MIVLVRHGQSVTNALNLLVGRSDPELTELGERQARALRALLNDVAAVWTSPLTRARSTAQLCVPDVDARVIDAFIEVDYGDLDGHPLGAVTPAQWREFQTDHSYRLGGGESLASVDARVHAELDRLLADDESLLHQPRRHLVIVSHVSPIKSAMVWALGVAGSVAWRTRLDNGSLTTIGTREGTPRLIHFNVVPRLG
ncbi:MAG: histidine phosphatase family protein [Acidimicrobiales bacterium]